MKNYLIALGLVLASTGAQAQLVGAVNSVDTRIPTGVAGAASGAAVLDSNATLNTMLSASPSGARSAINIPFKYSAEDTNTAGTAAGDAREIRTGYYIAAGSSKLYAGTVFPVGFGASPVSAGGCYIQNGGKQVGIPSVVSNTVYVGQPITFIGVNGGADWSSTITSFANIGYTVVNVSDAAPFAFNASCTVVVGSSTFTTTDVGKGIGVQYAGAASSAFNTWLNTTVSSQLLLGSGAVNPSGVQLAASSSLLITSGGSLVVGTDDSTVVNQAFANVIIDPAVSKKFLLVNKPHYVPTLSPTSANAIAVGDGKLLGSPISALRQVASLEAQSAMAVTPANRMAPRVGGQFAAALAAQTAAYKYPKVSVTSGGTGFTAGTYPFVVNGGPTGWAGTYTADATGRVVYATVTNSGTAGSGAPTLTFPTGGGSGAVGVALQGATSVFLGDSISTSTPDGITAAGKLMAAIHEKEARDTFSSSLTGNYATGAQSFVNFYDRGIGGTRWVDWAGYAIPAVLQMTSGGSGYTDTTTGYTGGGPYTGAVTGGPTGFAFKYYIQNGSAVGAYVTNPGVGSATGMTVSFPSGGAGQPATGSGAVATVTTSIVQPSWEDSTTDTILSYIRRLSPDRVYLHLGYNDSSTFSYPAMLAVVNTINAWTIKPDIVFVLTYPPSIEIRTAGNAYSANTGVQSAVLSQKYFAQANGYSIIDNYSTASLVRDGQSPERNSQSIDTAVASNLPVSNINWLSPYLWPTLTTDFSFSMNFNGSNWASCGNELAIAFNNSFAAGNTFRIGKDTSSGNYYYQFDTGTTLGGSPSTRTSIAKTITSITANATFNVAVRGGRVTVISGADSNAIVFDGYIERAGGMSQPLLSTATACKYSSFFGAPYVVAMSGYPHDDTLFIPATTDYGMHGDVGSTTVATTLSAAGTTLQVANAFVFAAPNPNPLIQAAITGGTPYGIQIGSNIYFLTGASITTAATGAGTITLNSSVSVADGTSGNAVTLGRSQYGGDGTHPTTAIGELIYQRVLDQSPLGAQ